MLDPLYQQAQSQLSKLSKLSGPLAPNTSVQGPSTPSWPPSQLRARCLLQPGHTSLTQGGPCSACCCFAQGPRRYLETPTPSRANPGPRVVSLPAPLGGHQSSRCGLESTPMHLGLWGDHTLRNLQGIHQGQYHGHNSTPHSTVAQQLLLVSHGPGQGLVCSRVQLVASCSARPFSSSPESCQENHPRPGDGLAGLRVQAYLQWRRWPSRMSPGKPRSPSQGALLTVRSCAAE